METKYRPYLAQTVCTCTAPLITTEMLVNLNSSGMAHITNTIIRIKRTTFKLLALKARAALYNCAHRVLLSAGVLHHPAHE